MVMNQPPKPEKPHLPVHLMVRCKVPKAGGVPCGFYRNYRVMPQDYDVENKLPEDIQRDLNENLKSKMLNWFRNHFERDHPHEAADIRKKVDRVTSYLILSELDKFVLTEHD